MVMDIKYYLEQTKRIVNTAVKCIITHTSQLFSESKDLEPQILLCILLTFFSYFLSNCAVKMVFITERVIIVPHKCVFFFLLLNFTFIIHYWPKLNASICIKFYIHRGSCCNHFELQMFIVMKLRISLETKILHSSLSLLRLNCSGRRMYWIARLKPNKSDSQWRYIDVSFWRNQFPKFWAFFFTFQCENTIPYINQQSQLFYAL